MPFVKRLIFFLIILQGSALAYQSLSAGIGGGYSGNLFSDSFALGNSYLLNNLSLSTVQFNSVKLRLAYDISYYQYDTGDIINNILHVPEISLYQRDPSRKLKWGVYLFAALKDYLNASSSYDNYRIFLVGDISYYLYPGLQLKGLYRGNRSIYKDLGSLDNTEHTVQEEIVATFPSKTTARAAARYAFRNFDERVSPLEGSSSDYDFYWFDVEIGVSQSLGIRTGLSLRFQNRWSGGGTRPLESYFVISGTTAYWDPWDGNQVEFEIKRILPFAIVSKIDADYWNREFAFGQIFRDRFSWLQSRAGRRDHGWSVAMELNRQLNVGFCITRAVKIFIGGIYTSNDSDDPFYKYDYFSANTSLKIQIF